MSLIQDIRNAVVEQGELAVCWLGQAGFVVKSSMGKMLTIDPYLTDCGWKIRGFKRISALLVDPAEFSPDYYIATHIHFDHFDYDAIPVVAERSPKTQFWGPSSCMKELEKLNIPEKRCHHLDWEESWSDNTVSIRAIKADHGTMAPDAIGVLLQMEGHRLYFSGDTAFREDLFREAAKYLPDAAFMSVNGEFGNLTGEEGARAAELCKAKNATACHCWTFMEHRGDPVQFYRTLEQVAPKCCGVRFRQGEIMILGRDNVFRERSMPE